MNALVLEVFDKHLILNYKRVTSQTQSLKKIMFQHWLEWSHFTFSKLLWSKIIGFAIHKVKFFFVEMSYSFLFNYLLILDQIIQSRSHYGVVYRFSNRSCLALSMTSITRPKEMIPKPAFRYYNSLLQRRQTAAAKVLYKMHTNQKTLINLDRYFTNFYTAPQRREQLSEILWHQRGSSE